MKSFLISRVLTVLLLGFPPVAYAVPTRLSQDSCGGVQDSERTSESCNLAPHALLLTANARVVRDTRPSAETTQNRFGAWAGYFAHAFSSPGAQVGLDYTLARAGSFASLLSLSVYGYNAVDAETGYGVQLGLTQRYRTRFGVVFEDRFGAGAQSTVYRMPVFSFDGEQGTREDRTETFWGFGPWFTLGAGYDFQKLAGLSLTLYARAGMMWVVPDQHGALRSSTIGSAGLLYPF